MCFTCYNNCRIDFRLESVCVVLCWVLGGGDKHKHENKTKKVLSLITRSKNCFGKVNNCGLIPPVICQYAIEIVKTLTESH